MKKKKGGEGISRFLSPLLMYHEAPCFIVKYFAAVNPVVVVKHLGQFSQVAAMKPIYGGTR